VRETDIALDYLNRARMNRDSDADDGYDSHSGVRLVSQSVRDSFDENIPPFSFVRDARNLATGWRDSV
jgi:hypothetical protein